MTAEEYRREEGEGALEGEGRPVEREQTPAEPNREPDLEDTASANGDATADEQPLDPRDWEESRGAPGETPAVGKPPPAGGRKSSQERAKEAEERARARTSSSGTRGLKRDHGSDDAVEFIDVVKKSFGRNRMLNGLNLGMPNNQISMILGPSGTGKSVCIKHMVGLLYPDEGDVLVHGESVPNMVDEELFEMRKKFGVLFQDGALFGSMNVSTTPRSRCVSTPTRARRRSRDIVSRRLREVGLADAMDKMPNELSGGMRKRAGFARALVLDPEIVLFDEPDSGLDPVRTALLCELIQEVHAENGGAYVRDHPRHHVRPPGGRLHRGPVEGQDRGVGAGQ